jgi:hypothetical protein
MTCPVRRELECPCCYHFYFNGMVVANLPGIEPRSTKSVRFRVQCNGLTTKTLAKH